VIDQEEDIVAGDWRRVTSRLKWMITELKDAGALAEGRVSDTFLIIAPAPPREQERFLKNIRTAALKFKKISRGENKWNVVFMRVHALADVMYLCEAAQQILSSPDMPVDHLIVYQPSYVRNAENRSFLHHAVIPVVSERFVVSRNPPTPIRMSPPVGVAHNSPSLFVAGAAQQALSVLSNMYVYQQGDIYRSASEGEYASLASPVSGIRQHAVFRGQIYSDSMQAPYDDLLVV